MSKLKIRLCSCARLLKMSMFKLDMHLRASLEERGKGRSEICNSTPLTFWRHSIFLTPSKIFCFRFCMHWLLLPQGHKLESPGGGRGGGGSKTSGDPGIVCEEGQGQSHKGVEMAKFFIRSGGLTCQGRHSFQ